MYESHFGLQEAPFALTPNTRYFLRAPSHSEALELLLVALRQREGFIKVTGEVGTGKTLLCRLLLNELDKDACKIGRASRRERQEISGVIVDITNIRSYHMKLM